MKTLKINFDGLLKSPASWAKVSRELLKALIERNDTEVAVQPRRGFNWDRSFALDRVLTERPNAHDDPDVRLTFTFPPLLDRENRSDTFNVLLSLYEATELPPSWIEPLRTFDGMIFVPTRHVESIYKQNGIPDESLARIPYGYDPDRYHPDPSSVDSNDPRRLLSLATPHYRKGIDYLLSMNDVAADPSLDWTVHLPYRPTDRIDFWEDPRTVEKLLSQEFTVSIGTKSDDEIAEALREASLVVQPSRSEGFGLVILEAMASGTPAITSNWGGHLDFSGKGMIRINGAPRAAGRAQYHQRAPGARVYELESTTLRSTVRTLLKNPTRLRRLGTAARSTVEPFTWNRSADRMMSVIKRRLAHGS